MLLECKITLLKRLLKIKVLEQFVAIDGNLDSSHFLASPNVVSNFEFVSKPSIWLNDTFIDMAHAIERPSSNRVRVRAVNLSFISVGKARLPSAAKIESRVPLVIDLDFRSVFEVLVWALGANEHGCSAGTGQRTVHYFPFTIILANFLPSLHGLAVKQRNPFRILGMNGTLRQQCKCTKANGYDKTKRSSHTYTPGY